MFDSETKKPLCIVDLDTVDASLCYLDFGDSPDLVQTTAPRIEL